MKTTEQIKQEVINYLNKTINHIFIKPKAIYVGSKSINGYEYDYNIFTYFKIIKDGDDFIIIDGDKVSKINIDRDLQYYGVNTKCVIKHFLFINKKMISTKYNKDLRNSMNDILNNSKIKAKDLAV